MVLSPATPDHAPAIAALIRPLARDFLIAPDDPAAAPFWASVDEAAERGCIASPRHAYTVAMQGGRLAGFIAMRDTWHVFHLFVAAPLQRQGLGARLWRHARDQALAQAADHPPPPPGAGAAFTVNASLPAVPFYQRLGFVVQGAPQAAHGIRFQPMRLALVAALEP